MNYSVTMIINVEAGTSEDAERIAFAAVKFDDANVLDVLHLSTEREPAETMGETS
jgi:hypothetical protein